MHYVGYSKLSASLLKAEQSCGILNGRRMVDLEVLSAVRKISFMRGTHLLV